MIRLIIMVQSMPFLFGATKASKTPETQPVSCVCAVDAVTVQWKSPMLLWTPEVYTGTIAVNIHILAMKEIQ